MELKVFKVENNWPVQRIDKFLTQMLKVYSREFVKTLCKKKYVKINGKLCNPDVKVHTGDTIEVSIPERCEYIVSDVKGNIEIIYEDTDLIVLNKPPFLKVHPARKFDTETTLMDWLCKISPEYLQEEWPLQRPFLVHRLDKDTSGVMVVAKTPQTQYFLAKQFQHHKVKKVYRAIVSGVVNVQYGEILAPVRVEKNISKIHPLGKQAKTNFKVLSIKDGFSYLELYPFTGRTHQIRAHLSFIGYPIIGDTKYGGPSEVKGKILPRYMLHSYRIEFYHTRREQWVKFTAELPQDFKFFLSYLSL
ncbi:MAG: RluA family pseudouridine synthase [Endomicrobia bacterium]|nr:RluA family pseudouridine synthase [Endomicrobiia bacterium]